MKYLVFVFFIALMSCNDEEECKRCRVVSESNEAHLEGFAGPEFRRESESAWVNDLCDDALDAYRSTANGSSLLTNSTGTEYTYKTFAECE